MKKGINALEIIFGLFVMIIVVLVIIRLFIKQVGPETLQPVQNQLNDISDSFGFIQAKNECGNLCTSYQLSSCDLADAVDFCQKKVQIDIDENGVSGESSPGAMQHGAGVRGIPYCEDGLYCFDIMEDCGCASIVLNPDTCDVIMCEYYMIRHGFTEEEAKGMVKQYVNTGTCKMTLQAGPLQLDTIMGSGKNWFDRRGMGDCVISGTSIVSGFELSLGACEVDAASKEYSCDVSGLTGNCDLIVISISNSANEQYGHASTAEGHTINLDKTKLQGIFVLEEDPLPDISSGECNLQLVCGDENVRDSEILNQPTSCSFV